MSENFEHQEGSEDTRDTLLRIDYLEIRVAKRLDDLEERIRHLESSLRKMNDSGYSDIHRLKNMGVALLNPTMSNDVDLKTSTEKPFRMTMRQTAIGVFVLAGAFSLARASNSYDFWPEALGRWLGLIIFCTLIPGTLAFVVAGRKKQWARNDRWFFWGCVIAFIVAVAVNSQH